MPEGTQGKDIIATAESLSPTERINGRMYDYIFDSLKGDTKSGFEAALRKQPGGVRDHAIATTLATISRALDLYSQSSRKLTWEEPLWDTLFGNKADSYVNIPGQSFSRESKQLLKIPLATLTFKDLIVGATEDDPQIKEMLSDVRSFQLDPGEQNMSGCHLKLDFRTTENQSTSRIKLVRLVTNEVSHLEILPIPINPEVRNYGIDMALRYEYVDDKIIGQMRNHAARLKSGANTESPGIYVVSVPSIYDRALRSNVYGQIQIDRDKYVDQLKADRSKLLP